MAAIFGLDFFWFMVGKLVGALVAAGIFIVGLFFFYVGGFGMVVRYEVSKFFDIICDL